MLSINVIAALIMLFTLLPAAKLTRRFITGLIETVSGSDPADDAGRGSFYALGNIGRSATGRPATKSNRHINTSETSKSASPSNSGSGSGKMDSDTQTTGGHLPEKQVSPEGRKSSIVDQYGQPISSSAGGSYSRDQETYGDSHTEGSYGGSYKAGTDQNTGGAAYTSGAQTTDRTYSSSRAGRRTSPSPAFTQKVKKYSSTGARVGGIVGKLPAVALGVGMGAAFGPWTGIGVARAAGAASRIAGGAVGGATGMIAHGGGRVIHAINQARGPQKNSGGSTGYSTMGKAKPGSTTGSSSPITGTSKSSSATGNFKSNQRSSTTGVSSKTTGTFKPDPETAKQRKIPKVQHSPGIDRRSHLSRPEKE